MTSPARQLGHIRPVPPPASSPGGAESYKRLADVFHQLLAEQELDTLLEQVAETLGDIVPYDTLTVYEAEESARELVAVYARDRWADQIVGSRVSYGEGITGWAALNRQPVPTNAAHTDPRRKTVPGTPDDEPEALVCIPLLARARSRTPARASGWSSRRSPTGGPASSTTATSTTGCAASWCARTAPASRS